MCPYLQPKTKLDPDSILLIKGFLEIIDLFNLNENENFIFNSELFKSFEKLDFPDWSQYYPINNDLKDSPLSLINDMEMEFPIDFKDEEKILNESPIVKEIRKLNSKEQLENEEPYLNKKQADLILACYANLNFLLCSALFGESPFELFKKAKNGDQSSILKLIRLDKSLIESDWSMREIKKAQLSGDKDYFKQLSKVLIKDSFKSIKKNLKLSMVLVCGWELGLNKLSNEEILDLVIQLGVYEGTDADTLYREIKRLGLKKRKQKSN
jgi:hypothetical protein